MDIGTVDIKTFGHLLEGDATRRELQEGLGLLERAQAATETEARAIEGSMDHAFRLGRGGM